LAVVLLCVTTQTSGFGGTVNRHSINWTTAVSNVSTACWPHVAFLSALNAVPTIKTGNTKNKKAK